MTRIRDVVVHRLRVGGCVWAEEEADLLLDAATTDAELDGLIRRRVAGAPLEHVLGWAAFCGLRLAVAPGVFVPRRRTEFLVHTAVRNSPPTPIVLDLCAGVGALGVAFAALTTGTQRRVAELHVAELDPIALACARRNVPVGTVLYEGDLYEPLPTALHGRVDVLLANAPYVPAGELGLLPGEARDYESVTALDGGSDGLDVHRRIGAGAPRWLAPGGTLYIEVSEGQHDTAVDLMAAAGLSPRVEADAELGATVVLGTRRADPLTS